VAARRGAREVAVEPGRRQRRGLQAAPDCEQQCRRPQRPVSGHGRLEDTAVPRSGHWASLSRAVDTEGPTRAVRLRAPREQGAAEAG